MTSRAGVGDMGILKVPAATNQGFQSMIPNEDVPSYFLYSMQSFISKEANRLASGSTFSEISGKQVSKISINVPSEQGEKGQIGKLFEQLNKLITVNQLLNQKSLILLINYIYAVKKPSKLTDDLHLLFI